MRHRPIHFFVEVYVRQFSDHRFELDVELELPMIALGLFLQVIHHNRDLFSSVHVK